MLHQTATDKARARELAVLALAEFEHSPGLRADRAFSLFDEALGLWDCAEIRASRDSCEAELNRRLAELIARITGLHTKASRQYEDKNYADCIATCEQALVLDQDTVYSQRADLEALKPLGANVLDDLATAQLEVEAAVRVHCHHAAQLLIGRRLLRGGRARALRGRARALRGRARALRALCGRA